MSEVHNLDLAMGELIHSALHVARTIISSDPILQDLDPRDWSLTLASVLIVAAAHGEQDIAKLAHHSVATLREREQTRRLTIQHYCKRSEKRPAQTDDPVLQKSLLCAVAIWRNAGEKRRPKRLNPDVQTGRSGLRSKHRLITRLR
jgi:hypothetical protein